MWLEDKEDEEEEELPTYLLSTLTEAQVLSILAKSKMVMISPRTSFQQQKPKHPFVMNLKPFCPPFEDNQESSSMSGVMWFGLPSSGWMGVLQVRGGKANRATDP